MYHREDGKSANDCHTVAQSERHQRALQEPALALELLDFENAREGPVKLNIDKNESSCLEREHDRLHQHDILVVRDEEEKDRAGEHEACPDVKRDAVGRP